MQRICRHMLALCVLMLVSSTAVACSSDHVTNDQAQQVKEALNEALEAPSYQVSFTSEDGFRSDVTINRPDRVEVHSRNTKVAEWLSPVEVTVSIGDTTWTNRNHLGASHLTFDQRSTQYIDTVASYDYLVKSALEGKVTSVDGSRSTLKISTPPDVNIDPMFQQRYTGATVGRDSAGHLKTLKLRSAEAGDFTYDYSDIGAAPSIVAPSVS